MASQFFGLNRGQDDLGPLGVTTGSSTGSTDVELRCDTGKSLTRKDVNILVERIMEFFNQGGASGNTSFPL